MPNRYVALDQSLSCCGFALWDEGDDLARSGSWELAPNVKQRGMGFVDLFRYLAEFHKEKPITAIAVEQPIKRPTDKVEKLIALYGLVAVVETFAKARNIPCHVIGIGKWRASYYTSGERVGKPDWKRMAIMRSRQYGYDPLDDNEAEAIGILDHFLLSMEITPKWRLEHPFVDTL